MIVMLSKWMQPWKIHSVEIGVLGINEAFYQWQIRWKLTDSSCASLAQSWCEYTLTVNHTAVLSYTIYKNKYIAVLGGGRRGLNVTFSYFSFSYFRSNPRVLFEYYLTELVHSLPNTYVPAAAAAALTKRGWAVGRGWVIVSHSTVEHSGAQQPHSQPGHPSLPRPRPQSVSGPGGRGPITEPHTVPELVHTLRSSRDVQPPEQRNAQRHGQGRPAAPAPPARPVGPSRTVEPGLLLCANRVQAVAHVVIRHGGAVARVVWDGLVGVAVARGVVSGLLLAVRPPPMAGWLPAPRPGDVGVGRLRLLGALQTDKVDEPDAGAAVPEGLPGEASRWVQSGVRA